MQQIPTQCCVAQIYSADQGIKYETKPIKQVNENEVLVKIDATGIGHFENLLMSGKINLVTFPFVPGTGAVGRVVKAGKGAEYLLGKRVATAGMTDFWAEYAVVNIYAAFEIDEDVPIGSAAYGFGNPFTAIGLIETAKQKGKKSIVVDAAASALGKMIAKLAKKENLTVLCVVSRKDQEQVLKNEGITDIVVAEGDWKATYENRTKELQSDVLIDSLGTGPVFDILVRGLVPGGVVLIMGGLDGHSEVVSLGSTDEVEVDKYTFKGFNMFSWFQTVAPEEKLKLFKSHSQKLKNELGTTIAKTYHLKDIKEAVEESKKNQTKGKILVIP